MGAGHQGLQPPASSPPKTVPVDPYTLNMQEALERSGSDPRPSNTSISTQVTCNTCRGHAGGDTQMYATAPPTGNRRKRSNY